MRLILKNNYWKNIASVLTGSAVAQIIPILGALVIARLFAPVDFGLYASWLGVVLLLSVLITGRFETSLAIEQDGEPRRLAVFTTLITACLASLLLLLLFLIAFWFWPVLNQKIKLSLFIWAIPAALTIAIVQTWQSWAAAEGLYGKLSTIRIINASAITLLQILLGFFEPSATMLAFGYFVGSLMACGVSVKLMSIRRLSIHGSMLKSIKSFWYKQRRFPLFSLPADAINTAAAQLPIILVASRYGAEVAGLLAMTLRILGAPLGLLGKSVLDVFKRHASSHYREYGECRDIYVQTFKVLAVGSLIFILGMFFLSEEIFVIAFGEEWRFSGTIAQWMLPYFALAFIASPLSYMVYIAGRQNLDLLWQISLLVMTLTTLVLPNDYSFALKMYSAGYASLYVIYIIMSYRFSLGAKK